MTPKVSPWLEDLEATNLSEDLCGATLNLGAASPKGLLLPLPAISCPSSELLPCQACPFLCGDNCCFFKKVFVELHYFEILGRKILCKWKLKIKFLLEGICTFNFWLGLEKTFFLALKIETFCYSYHHFCFILKGMADNGEICPLFSVFHRGS